MTTSVGIAMESCQTIKIRSQNAPTVIDEYWGKHVVCSTVFQTAKESADYLEWRFHSYPLFREFSGLYGDHEGQTILDYGCGPGNDVIGFALYSRAVKIVAIDVSQKALDLATQRCQVHGIDPGRVEFIHSTDGSSTIPLPDNSVDFINCQGVLMVTSYPEKLLQEFFRILRPHGRAIIMVYNSESVYVHLFTAYERMIVQNAFPGLSTSQAFAKNVDGVNCPMARGYSPQEFAQLCESAGFVTEYAGGYLSDTEMDSLKRYRDVALDDPRLAGSHKEFIRTLTYDPIGYPLHQGRYAGIGGVFRLYAWNKAKGQDRVAVQLTVAREEVADVRHQVMHLSRRHADLQGQYSELNKRLNPTREAYKERLRRVPGVNRLLVPLYRVFRNWFLK